MTYKRDPRVAIGDTDYASAAGNPGDIANLTAGATSAFLQIIAGLPAWRTTVQATASLAVATQTLKGLLDAATFNKISAELINYVTNPNFQADTASAAAASWTATNATQICSTSGPIINTKSMRISPSATLTGTVDGDLNTLDGWVNTGGADKTLSLTFLSYGDTDYLDNEISFVIWNSTDSVEVAGTTSTIPLVAKYHKVSWVPATGKVYKLRFKTTVVATTHRIFVDSFVCGFEQERLANTALRGPATGAAAIPTFRATVGEDLGTNSPTAGLVLYSTGTNATPYWGTAGGGGMANPMSNVGDMIAGTTGGAPVTIPVPGGSAGEYILTGNGSGVPYWGLGPMTGNGDMMYRNSSGVLGRLPVGTNGQVLNASAGYPAWCDIGKVVLGAGAPLGAQSITSGSSGSTVQLDYIPLTPGTWEISYNINAFSQCVSGAYVLSKFYFTAGSGGAIDNKSYGAFEVLGSTAIGLAIPITRTFPVTVSANTNYYLVVNVISNGSGYITIMRDTTQGYSWYHAILKNTLTS